MLMSKYDENLQAARDSTHRRRAMECSRVEEVKLNERDTSGAVILNVTPFLHYSGGCCPWYKGSCRLEEAPAGLKVWPTSCYTHDGTLSHRQRTCQMSHTNTASS